MPLGEAGKCNFNIIANYLNIVTNYLYMVNIYVFWSSVPTAYMRIVHVIVIICT